MQKSEKFNESIYYKNQKTHYQPTFAQKPLCTILPINIFEPILIIHATVSATPCKKSGMFYALIVHITSKILGSITSKQSFPQKKKNLSQF